MPTYEYRCQQCATEFEVRQSFTDDPLTDCVDESCDGSVTKVFRGVGISFKGDGFYKNDHGSSSSGNRSSSTVDAGAKSTEPTSGSTSGSDTGSGSSSDAGSGSTSGTPAAAGTSSGS